MGKINTENMLRVGLICDTSFSRHKQFVSYLYAVERLLGPPVIIKDKRELAKIDLLIVGDDHYYGHKNILHQPGFIGICNTFNIHVLVLTTEKIFDSVFPWNEGNYEMLKQIRHLHHYTADIDDCRRLNTGLHRITISERFNRKFYCNRKKNKMVFIGKTKCELNSYKERIAVLEKVKDLVDIDIIESKFNNWDDYMRAMAEYRFVFCPVGNANFFPIRFYEVLAVGSIPVQQVKDNTLNWYDIEAKFKDCIFFRDVEDVPEKIETCTFEESNSGYWMEDNLRSILSREGWL